MADLYRLYGAELSLYSGKVRSYLRKKAIPFKEIRPTPALYKEFIEPRTGVRYIPVVQTPQDEVFQDTTVIIDELESRFPESSIYPKTAKQKLLALLFEVYGDEWLGIPAMHYRWNFKKENYRFVVEQFGQGRFPNSPKFVQRWWGAKASKRFQAKVPLLGITETMIPAIEKSYHELLAELQVHFVEHDYLLGNRPCIGDFGLIGPLYAHLYRDPHPGKLMKDHAPAVAKWVERMMSDDPIDGEFLCNDEIPNTLLPILQRMASEQLPYLLEADNKLTQFKTTNIDTVEIPQAIGKQSFSVEGMIGERVTLPYSLWMFQRPVNFYASLAAKDKHTVDVILQKAGFGKSLQQGLSNKLTRYNNILKFA